MTSVSRDDELPAADHRGRPHRGADQPVRPVEMDAAQKALIDRNAIVDQTARDEGRGALRHGAVAVDRRRRAAASEPVTSSRTCPSRIVTLALQLDRLVGDAVVVAEALRLVDALRQLADFAIRPALGVGDQLVEEIAQISRAE